MTNRIGHRVIAISRIFMKDQWKFLPWWLLSKSEYNECFQSSYDTLFFDLSENKIIPMNTKNVPNQ